MATNILTELDQQLASLNQLKPPGASKSKISSITSLCVNNIQVSTSTYDFGAEGRPHCGRFDPGSGIAVTRLLTFMLRPSQISYSPFTAH